MPTCWPDYSSYALIDYAYEDRDFAVWLRQRLFYEGIPSWADAVDRDGNCGAGTVEVVGRSASPLLVITSANSAGSPRPSYLNTALSHDRPIIGIRLDGVDAPAYLQDDRTIVDFRDNHDAAFATLASILRQANPTYPPIKSIDGSRQIEYGLEQLENPHPNIDLVIHCCLAAMRDLASASVRVRAIAQLGELRAQPGMLRAALRDPSSEVRAVASLALRLHQLLQRREPRRSATGGPVFISYARKDAGEFALRLTHALRDAGIDTWIDENLEPGTAVWVHEVERAIQRSKVCLFIISPAMRQSEWVAKEYLFARQFPTQIIPLKYLEAAVPLYLSSEQGLRPNLSFSDHYEQMIEVLIATLQSAS